jgi:hypothetical protein
MSQAFMYAIALMYVCAGVSFAWDGKIAWCVLSFSWATGNFILGFISK